MTTAATTLVPFETTVTEGITDRVFVTIDGRDFISELQSVGLTIDSTDREIMDRMTGVVREALNGADISQHYKVRKSVDSRNIYIIPNSTAG